MPIILLTNDDGIDAEGLERLRQELAKLGSVVIVAPDSEKSSVSHGITLFRPIRHRKVFRNRKFYGHAIYGTPADCVKFGVNVLLKKKPDLVVAGINPGANEGCSVFYSGTVAAAREGALMGIPSLAISLACGVDLKHFQSAAVIGRRIVSKILKYGLPGGTFLNVNVPNRPLSQITSIQPTRQSLLPIHSLFFKRKDPHGGEYFWMSGKVSTRNKNFDIDTPALQNGHVAVTPIRCDTTDEKFLTTIRSWNLQ